MKITYICGILILVLLSGCSYIMTSSNNETTEEPKTLEELKEEYWEKEGVKLVGETNAYTKYELTSYNGKGYSSGIYIFAMCRDKIICYINYNYDEGSCFRDQDLVDRYCNYKLGEMEEEE